MLENLLGFAGLAAGLTALLREAIHYRRTKAAQAAKLEALHLVDAEKLRAELWIAFRQELLHLRQKDERQQKLIEHLQIDARKAQEDLIESQRKRHTLRNEMHDLSMKFALLERENTELKAQIAELQVVVQGMNGGNTHT